MVSLATACRRGISSCVAEKGGGWVKRSETTFTADRAPHFLQTTWINDCASFTAWEVKHLPEQ